MYKIINLFLFVAIIISQGSSLVAMEHAQMPLHTEQRAHRRLLPPLVDAPQVAIGGQQQTVERKRAVAGAEDAPATVQTPTRVVLPGVVAETAAPQTTPILGAQRVLEPHSDVTRFLSFAAQAHEFGPGDAKRALALAAEQDADQEVAKVMEKGVPAGASFEQTPAQRFIIPSSLLFSVVGYRLQAAHKAAVTTLLLSEDAFLSGAQDGTVAIWKLPSGGKEGAYEIKSHGAIMTSEQFEQNLVIGTPSGLFECPIQNLVGGFQKRAGSNGCVEKIIVGVSNKKLALRYFGRSASGAITLNSRLCTFGYDNTQIILADLLNIAQLQVVTLDRDKVLRHHLQVDALGSSGGIDMGKSTVLDRGVDVVAVVSNHRLCIYSKGALLYGIQNRYDDVCTQVIVASQHTDNSPIARIALSSDMKTLMTINQSGEVVVQKNWGEESGQICTRFRLERLPSAVALDHAGSWVACGYADGSIEVRSVADQHNIDKRFSSLQWSTLRDYQAILDTGWQIATIDDVKKAIEALPKEIQQRAWGMYYARTSREPSGNCCVIQ